MKLTKRGTPDRRFLENGTREAKIELFWNTYKNWITAFIIALIALAVLETKIYRESHKQLIDPRGIPNLDVGTNKPAVKLKVQEVRAAEPIKDWNTDLIGYFRFRGQQIGYNDFDITKFHQVMDNENGLHTADRKNYLYDGENGRYTAAGFAMITNSTWRQHKCVGNKFNGVDNINCFYKIVGKNGLKDYYESKGKWGKLFDELSIKFIKL
jgi:hypothetical protein